MHDGLKPLAGRRALVTGGARRLGRAIAIELAAAGADVAITFRESATEASRTRDKIRQLDVRSLALPCDVRSEASVQEAVGAAIEEFGGLDLLVNNAGVFETEVLESVTVAQWDQVFATNTRGPFLVAKAAHAALKSSHGRIVNIGSLGGEHTWATHGHYCSSKAALHMLSHTMAKAWAPEVSVNCVAPGMISFGDPSPLAAKTPMRRDGSAEDVAAAVLFFAAGPHFITGQLLAVDGGLGL